MRGGNAIAAALLAVFFVVHAALGVVSFATGWQGCFAWVIFLGVAVVAVHVGLSVATTVHMFCDKERPASSKKKRHQCLKWATGLVLVCAVVVHMAGDPAHAAQGGAAAVALAAMVWHAFVGVKSLTRDLRLPKELRTPLRVALVVLGALLAGLAVLLA